MLFKPLDILGGNIYTNFISMEKNHKNRIEIQWGVKYHKCYTIHSHGQREWEWENKGNWSNAIRLVFIDIVVSIPKHNHINNSQNAKHWNMRTDFICIPTPRTSLDPIRFGMSHVHCMKCINIAHKQWFYWRKKN